MLISTTASPAGTYTVEDDGILGNGKGRIRGPGLLTEFAYPFGGSVEFDSGPGQKYVVNLLEGMVSSFRIGSLVDPALCPDNIFVRKLTLKFEATLVTSGAIVESGSDADADIMAGFMALSAGTGIGKNQAIETEVFGIEAETATGGIFLRNIRDAQIGGSSADVAGLSVATSGHIKFENVGDLELDDTDGPATVVGGAVSGDVTLTVTGAAASLTSSVDQQAILAAGGSIAVAVGKDLILGDGANFDNDVRARKNVSLSAGGSVILDGLTEIVADATGANSGGGVGITAGTGIVIDDSWGTGARVRAEGTAGGDVTLTVGTGGAFVLHAPSAEAVSSQSGDVTVNADRMLIAADSGISALNGVVTLRPQTEGHRINVNSPQDLSHLLELSDVEIDRIFAKTLVIGGTSAGSLLVTTGALTPANVPDLVLQSGADIHVQDLGAVAVTGKLVLRAGDDILLETGAGLTAGGGITAYVDYDNPDPGEGGNALFYADFAPALTLFGNADNDWLSSGKNNDTLDGGAGADTMIGRAGNDRYYVDNAGDDVVEALNEGTDSLYSTVTRTLGANLENLFLLGNADINGTGNTGNNFIQGNIGNNTLKGGSGNDTLLGGAGNDLLDGQGGNDTASYADATASVVVALVAGAQNTVGAGSDTLSAIENLTGSSYGDTLTGDGAANTLNGGDGSDTLVGGDGGDLLLGGIGADKLTGGLGVDVFYYRTLGESGTSGGTRDTILDFEAGTDLIQLSILDADSTTAGNQDFAFIGAAAFAGVAGQLRAQTVAANTVVSADVNGDATADFTILISGNYTLTAANFGL